MCHFVNINGVGWSRSIVIKPEKKKNKTLSKPFNQIEQTENVKKNSSRDPAKEGADYNNTLHIFCI